MPAARRQLRAQTLDLLAVRTRRPVPAGSSHSRHSPLLTRARNLCAQSNQTVNEDDKAYQSRQILIQFQPLRGADDDDHPDLYNQWNMYRELMSACTPDFETLLWKGKLDREAIQDCAHYLQAAIGKKRDRNANMWGILLYYMLNLNFLLNGDQNDIEEVFVWMIESVTGMVYTLNKHSSMVDQFVIAISKLRADGGTAGISNPLGPMDETIYWDKIRNIELNGVEFLCVRLEACVAVVKKVSKKEFKIATLKAAILKCDWAKAGQAAFYDASTHPWPICRTEVTPADIAPVKIPLTEVEAMSFMTNQHCVMFKKHEVDAIVRGVEECANLECDFRSIEVDSANSDIGTYNFYQRVTGIGCNIGWFGYRAAQNTPFAEFCGPFNYLPMPHEEGFALDTEVQALNEAAGFGDPLRMFEPASLLDHFNYAPYAPVRPVPPAFAKIPFTARDAEGDHPITSPFEHHPINSGYTREFPSPNYSPRRATVVDGANDVQTDPDDAPPPNGGIPGSSPLSAVGPNGPIEAPSGANPPSKRARKGPLRYSDDDDETLQVSARTLEPCAEQPQPHPFAFALLRCSLISHAHT